MIIPKTIFFNGVTYTITRVSDYAFTSIKSSSVMIPNTIKSIGMHAFSYLSKLKSFSFEENSKCESVGSWGLAINSPYFHSIVFPSSIKTLDSYVIYCISTELCCEQKRSKCHFYDRIYIIRIKS